jgi:hypothetical protein
MASSSPERTSAGAASPSPLAGLPPSPGGAGFDAWTPRAEDEAPKDLDLFERAVTAEATSTTSENACVQDT